MNDNILILNIYLIMKCFFNVFNFIFLLLYFLLIIIGRYFSHI